MGCNCGGSNNQSLEAHRDRMRAAAQRPATQGPKAPGYTWDGPEGAAVSRDTKPIPATTK